MGCQAQSQVKWQQSKHLIRCSFTLAQISTEIKLLGGNLELQEVSNGIAVMCKVYSLCQGEIWCNPGCHFHANTQGNLGRYVKFSVVC